MSFAVILYHEIRESHMLHPGEISPIDVRQHYEDNLPSPLFVTLEQFEAQMAYLADNKFHALSLSDISRYYDENTALPEKSVLVTFDDCFQSMGLYAYPILKKYQLHAAAFVVTGWLNKHQKPFEPGHSICMTEKDLYDMADIFEYANHTDSFHTREDETTSRMMTAGDGELLEDLERCNANPIVQAKDVFAYPFGLFDTRNVQLLREKGFRLAFTCQPGRNTRGDDPLLLKRNVIPHFMDMAAFQSVVG